MKYRSLVFLLLTLGGLTSLTACVSTDEYQQLKRQNELQAKIIHNSQITIEQLNREIHQLRQAQAKTKKETPSKN